MSLYVRKSTFETSDDRSRNARRIRRPPVVDSDIGVDDSKDHKSNPDLLGPGRQPSESKGSARNRKSKLIESMAANFENSSGTHTLSASTPTSRTTRYMAPIPKIKTEAPPDDPSPPEDDPSPKQSSKKSSASARKGKLQREKRMLRQKRRSTGVVNPKDIEESEKKDMEDNTEAETDLNSVTASNTQTNELSPASAYSTKSSAAKHQASLSVRDSNGTYKSSQVSIINTTSSVLLQPNRKTDHTPCLSGTRGQDGNTQARLEAAEATITKLRKEIEAMDDELCELEKENKQLRHSNKLLEDENRTLLLFIKK